MIKIKVGSVSFWGFVLGFLFVLVYLYVFLIIKLEIVIIVEILNLIRYINVLGMFICFVEFNVLIVIVVFNFVVKSICECIKVDKNFKMRFWKLIFFILIFIVNC